MNTLTQNRFQIALATVALASAFAMSVGAASAAELPVIRVGFADLNTNTTAGAAALYGRIRTASNQVCGVSDHQDLAQLAHAKACADRAIADAVAAVRSDTLNSVYQAKSGITVAKMASN